MKTSSWLTNSTNSLSKVQPGAPQLINFVDSIHSDIVLSDPCPSLELISSPNLEETLIRPSYNNFNSRQLLSS
jgi:hypothetical protein